MKSGTMSAERILIDTSVWIEYFRNQSPGFVGFVEGIAKDREICVPGIILVEQALTSYSPHHQVT
jgi:predicted nucleic acid-binding protein